MDGLRTRADHMGRAVAVVCEPVVVSPFSVRVASHISRGRKGGGKVSETFLSTRIHDCQLHQRRPRASYGVMGESN